MCTVVLFIAAAVHASGTDLGQISRWNGHVERVE